MNRSSLKGTLIAVVAGLMMVCGTLSTASAQTRFRYSNNGQISTYPSRTYMGTTTGQRYVSPSNRYSQVAPVYRVAPNYNTSQNFYTQPYRSGYRGSATVYPGYNSNQYYAPGYTNRTPGYYPAPGYSSGYRGYVGPGYASPGYASPGQQRGAAIGGTIGGAVGGNRGGNIGAAIGAAVGQ